MVLSIDRSVDGWSMNVVDGWSMVDGCMTLLQRQPKGKSQRRHDMAIVD
jgi:hypothetical protein